MISASKDSELNSVGYVKAFAVGLVVEGLATRSWREVLVCAATKKVQKSHIASRMSLQKASGSKRFRIPSTSIFPPNEVGVRPENFRATQRGIRNDNA